MPKLRLIQLIFKGRAGNRYSIVREPVNRAANREVPHRHALVATMTGRYSRYNQINQKNESLQTICAVWDTLVAFVSRCSRA
jgi:hypothetical protein